MAPLRRILGGARTRILAAFVVLMVFSTVVSIIGIYEVLAVRAGDRLDASLNQEIEEFRVLSRGIDPNDGEPFGNDLEGIFSLVPRPQRPADGEVIVMFVDGRPLQPLSKARGGQLNLDAQIPRWGRLTRPSRGEFETPTDSVRYVAVPVRPWQPARAACSWSPPR